MKAGDFRRALLGWADQASEATAVAARALAQLFDPSDTVAILTRLEGLSIASTAKSRVASPSNLEAIDALEAFRSSLPASKKKALSPDLRALKAILAPRPELPIVSSVESLRSQFASDKQAKRKRPKTVDKNIVDYYVRLLESVLKDPQAFLSEFEKLQQDKRVKQPEAALIAKEFYGDASARTPRAEAMRRIRERHISLEDHRAKARAQAGKSAA